MKFTLINVDVFLFEICQIISENRHDFTIMSPFYSPETRRPCHEADHSIPSGTEVKNAWSYTSIHRYVFVLWVLIEKDIRLLAWILFKLKDNFTSMHCI